MYNNDLEIKILCDNSSSNSAVSLNKPIVLSSHTANYLPYIGFFNKVSKSDILVIDDLAYFSKRGFGHRNMISTSQGACLLTIPMSSKSVGLMAKDLKFKDCNNSEKNWNLKHWKSIELNYSKSPFFKEYSSKFKDIFLSDYEYLQDFSLAIIDTTLDLLDINVKIKKSSELYNSNEPKIPDLTDRLLFETIRAGGNIYLSGSGGKNYIDNLKISNSQIKLEYQNFKHPIYNQKYLRELGFIPNLAIIDLLFNEGPKSKDIVRYPENYSN